MPLAFNLLAPWGHALERASSYLIELLPAFTGTARQLLFEHSPGRGNPKFTGDYTAFDAAIRYSWSVRKLCFGMEPADDALHRLARRDGIFARAAQIDEQLHGRKQHGEPMGDLDRERRLADAADALERRDRQRPALPRQRRRDGVLLLDPSREIGRNLGQIVEHAGAATGAPPLPVARPERPTKRSDHSRGY
jgi:hypothetical protein